MEAYKESISKCDHGFLANSTKSFLIQYKHLDFEREIIARAKQFVSKIKDYKLPFDDVDGVALLYGVNAKMEKHTDSLSRPSISNEEWTFTVNIGCDICFCLNDQPIIAHSGDILVMDSRVVMHGVTKIIPNTCPRQLPLKNARFGIIFWESA